MTPLDFILQRVSTPANYLDAPAPNREQLHTILQAGTAAPDHCALRPWKFIVIEGDARHKLGDVFVEATRLRDPDWPQDRLEMMRKKPLRAPMIIAVIADITPDHNKAPEVEQLLSAGAAAQQILLAATAMGFGAIWLTGPNARDAHVKGALGLAEKDHIVGFIYVGTSSKERIAVSRPDPNDFLTHWQG
ncbi:MAG TPA: nitroreductase [Gammaproteobacteria bacterium]|jgi:nitroreductase|nr:nitroreductase [Gammaproteobacteria bacterium]